MARYIVIKKTKAIEAGLNLPRMESKDGQDIMFFEDDLLIVGTDVEEVAQNLESEFITQKEALNLIEKNF